MAASRFDENLPIVRARFALDLAEAIAEVERRVAHLFRGPLALLNPLAKTVFHHLGIPEAKKRVEVQLALHERASREVPEVGLREATERHLPEVLANDDFLARVDRSHVAAPDAVALVAAGYRARLPPIAKLLHEGVGDDFDALVRSVLTRAEVEEVLAEEFAVARRLIALAEERPGLVRVPRAFLPRVASVARDLLAWYEAKAARDVSRIYDVKTS